MGKASGVQGAKVGLGGFGNFGEVWHVAKLRYGFKGLDGFSRGRSVNHCCRGESRLGLGPKSGFIGGRVKPRALVEVRTHERVISGFGVGFWSSHVRGLGRVARWLGLGVDCEPRS